jgi:hypothetical protein
MILIQKASECLWFSNVPARKIAVNMRNEVSVNRAGPVLPAPKMAFSTRLLFIDDWRSPAPSITSSIWHAALTVLGTDIALLAASQSWRQTCGGL